MPLEIPTEYYIFGLVTDDIERVEWHMTLLDIQLLPETVGNLR